MNSLLKQVIEEETPKVNDIIMSGSSRPYIESLPDYLDDVIKSAMKTLNDDIPLEYMGYRMLTPLEDFYNDINSTISKNTVDISRNYLYKLEYKFIYDDIEVNRIISLPFVDRGGILELSDTHYSFSTVLSEYPISPAPGEVFVRLLRDKLNIKSMQRHVLKDGVRTPLQIIFSKSYKLFNKDNNKVSNKIPMVLYMLVKHGFYGLFKKYFDATPKVIVGRDLKTEHLKDKYIEYTTTGLKPRALTLNALNPNYKPHEIRIFIEKDKITPYLESVIGMIIYAFDLSPLYSSQLLSVLGQKKEPNTIVSFGDIDDETLFWITLLGKIVFKNNYSLDRVQADMLEHIDILNGYLDPIIKKRLKYNNIDLEDFYELVAWTVENYNELTRNYEQYSSNLNNRYIDLPYYILFDLIVGINKAFLEIKRTASKKKLNEVELNKLFNKFISTKKIFTLIKGGAGSTNIAITPIDYTADNLYFKITSILEDQNSADGVRRSKNNVMPPNTRTLRAEDLLLGSMLFLLKKKPSPRFRFNIFLGLAIQTGKILIDEVYKERVDIMGSLLVDTSDSKTATIDILDNEIDKDVI